MIGSCPECNESIRIPEGNAHDIVRCPLCNAEYELEKALRSLPPELEIIKASGAALGIDVGDSADNELTLKKAESIESGSTPSRRYQPRRRKEVNVFAELIKVILGGVVAIPVGVVCIWWFAGKAPFGIAETVSEYVPWAVPEKLRSKSMLDESDSPENESDFKSNNVQSQKQPSTRKLGKSPQGGGVIGLEKSIEGDYLNAQKNNNAEAKGVEDGNAGKKDDAEKNSGRKKSDPVQGNADLEEAKPAETKHAPPKNNSPDDLKKNEPIKKKALDKGAEKGDRSKEGGKKNSAPVQDKANKQESSDPKTNSGGDISG